MSEASPQLFGLNSHSETGSSSELVSPNYCFVNGKIVPESQARVSVMDHGLLFGDGVFEGVAFYEGRVFRLREHIQYLLEAAKALLLDPGMSWEQLESAALATVGANQLEEGYLRFVLTRGVGRMNVSTRSCKKAGVILLVSEAQRYAEERYERGLELITCATRRPSPGSHNPRLKSLNYLTNVMAKMECQQAGCDEGIMLNELGYVAEGTSESLFVVKNKVVCTPAGASGAIDGVARRAALELLVKRGLQVREDLMTRHEIYTADECFMVSTEAEVVPAVVLDRRRIGNGVPGPVTVQLMEDYAQLVRSEGTAVTYAS
jgi:branched-chain amino acid aminotransferase